MTVWLHLQNLFLVVALIALLGAVGFSNHRLWAWGIILFTGFSPVMLNNLYGQANLLYLAILSGYAMCFQWDRLPTCPKPQTNDTGAPPEFANTQKSDRLATCPTEILAALLLSVAISIRILPVALLAMALIQRRYRLAVLTIGLVALEATAAGAVVGFPTEWHYFTSYVFRLGGLENMREISLLALAGRIAPSPQLATALYLAVVAAGVAIFFAFVYSPMRRNTPSPLLHLAFVMASMVLFAPLLEYHHYCLLLAPYLLVLGHLAASNRLTLMDALPVFGSWAIVSGANQLSHFQFGDVGFAALAGAALIWGHVVWLLRNDEVKSREEQLRTRSAPA